MKKAARKRSPVRGGRSPSFSTAVDGRERSVGRTSPVSILLLAAMAAPRGLAHAEYLAPRRTHCRNDLLEPEMSQSMTGSQSSVGGAPDFSYAVRPTRARRSLKVAGCWPGWALTGVLPLT